MPDHWAVLFRNVGCAQENWGLCPHESLCAVSTAAFFPMADGQEQPGRRQLSGGPVKRGSPRSGASGTDAVMMMHALKRAAWAPWLREGASGKRSPTM